MLPFASAFMPFVAGFIICNYLFLKLVTLAGIDPWMFGIVFGGIGAVVVVVGCSR